MQLLRKTLSLILCLTLLWQQAGFAQAALTELNINNFMPAKGLVQENFRPPHLRYFQYDPRNENFNVLLDKGGLDGNDKDLNKLTQTLLSYFLIGVTLPNDCFWVNLRPDAETQVIDERLARTDVGRIMLEADLQLKKDTANFTSPRTPEGREYWDRLYKKAEELFGTDNVTIPTINRPWIVPNEVIVRESGDNAFVYKATLKVMLEQDYLKDSTMYSFNDERSKKLNEYASQMMRELIIPKLTKEVNVSRRYAQLRQVFYSLILARWFKARFSGKEGFYASLINKEDLTDLVSRQQWSADTYFNAYKQSFAQGEYNIKEEVRTLSGPVIKSYVSGGIKLLASSSLEGGFSGSRDVLPALAGWKGGQVYGGTAAFEQRLPALHEFASSSLSNDPAEASAWQRKLRPIAYNRGLNREKVIALATLLYGGVDTDQVIAELEPVAYNRVLNLEKVIALATLLYAGVDTKRTAAELKPIAYNRILNQEKVIALAALLYSGIDTERAIAELQPIAYNEGLNLEKVIALTTLLYTGVDTEQAVAELEPIADRKLLNLEKVIAAGAITYFSDKKEASSSIENADKSSVFMRSLSALMLVTTIIFSGCNNVPPDPQKTIVVEDKTLNISEKQYKSAGRFLELENALESFDLNLEEKLIRKNLEGLKKKFGLIWMLNSRASGESKNLASIAKTYPSVTIDADFSGMIFMHDGQVVFITKEVAGKKRMLTYVQRDFSSFGAATGLMLGNGEGMVTGYAVGQFAGIMMSGSYLGLIDSPGILKFKGNNKVEGVLPLQTLEKIAADGSASSSLLEQEKDQMPDAPGGIDFRAIDIVFNPLAAAKNLNFALPRLSQAELDNINLDEELRGMKSMIDDGTLPSGQRVKELVAACSQKDEMAGRTDDLMLCLIGLCRLEELQAGAGADEFKEVLVILEQ